MRFSDQFQEILESQSFVFPVFGSVESYDSTAKTATIRPAVTLNGTSAPNLLRVPVLLPGGGGWDVHLTPQSGDLALVVFCGQRVCDWWESSRGSEQTNSSLSDGVAIIFSRRTAVTSGVLIQNALGTTSLEITDTDVKITIAGIPYSWLTHTHSGVTVGSGASGPPVAGG